MTVVHRHFTDNDTERCAELVGLAFGFPPQKALPWFDALGQENLRVAAVHGTVVGTVSLIPMGQYFHGEPVPMTGIAGVVVALDQRGRGLAASMMRQVLGELHAAKVPISSLYPSTQALYRKLGWARAGYRFRLSLDVREIPRFQHDFTTRRGEPDDEQRLVSLQSASAARVQGRLRRGPYCTWKARREPPGEMPLETFLVCDGDEIVAFLRYYLSPQSGGPFDITITDQASTSLESAGALLELLRGHRSVGGSARWFGGPMGPLIAALGSRRATIELADTWMLRVVHLPSALEKRAFPPVVSGTLDLDVVDTMLPANSGRWRLVVEAGQATVEPGGDGDLSMDIRTLATLYSGLCTPAELGLQASESALNLASALFASTTPIMRDMF